MFDIGGLELLIIAVVGLLVIGPERLPETLRTLGLWLGRLRRSFTTVKTEIEKEIGMDEVRRQLHNEAVMDQMKALERDVKSTLDEAKVDPIAAAGADTPDDTTADAATAEANVVDVATENSIQAPQTPATDEDTPDATSEEEPPKRRPPTEAEVEAAFERKMARQQAEQE